MADINDILKSPELNNVIRAIEELLEKHDLPRKNPGDKTFKYLALGNKFRAAEVIKILLDNNQAYPGFKEVLSAGLIGWLLLPTLKSLRNNMMIQEVIWILDNTERNAGLLDEPLSLGRDLVARYVLTGFDFLKDIYNEFGGYEAFTRSVNDDNFAEAFSTERKVINTVVRAIAYMHHAADRFKDSTYDFAPSLNRAVSIMAELKKRPDAFDYSNTYVSRSLLHERWSSAKPTLALLYAASTIRVGRNTLLNAMMDLKITYSFLSELLDEWLGRAAYVSDHIFAAMTDVELQRQTEMLLPTVQRHPFRPPELSSLELTILVSQFRKRLKSV